MPRLPGLHSQLTSAPAGQPTRTYHPVCHWRALRAVIQGIMNDKGLEGCWVWLSEVTAHSGLGSRVTLLSDC